MPDFSGLPPAAKGVAPELDIDLAKQRGDKFAVVFEGYIDIQTPGAYNLYLTTAKADACRVYLNGQQIIDNDLETAETIGLANLAKGKHALRIEFLDHGWGEMIRMALRRIDGAEKQPVTADMLSH
jgi:hexosaminidase